MSYKLFPHTASGNQLRLVFDEIEERDAFERALNKLQELSHLLTEAKSLVESELETNERPLSGVIYDSNNGAFRLNHEGVLFTTLEYDVLMDKDAHLNNILGTSVCNVYSRSSVSLSIWC